MCWNRIGLAVLTAGLLVAAHRGYAADPTLSGSVLNSQAAETEAARLASEPPVRPPNHIAIDRSGRREVGKASFYGRHFEGRTMATGDRFDPSSHVAASKSLPLGTIARVTNQKTGQSTQVQIKDRGPFVDGRVVDLAPKAAREIGIGPKNGVAPVTVAPVVVPQPDGSLKAGAGAAQPTAELRPADSP